VSLEVEITDNSDELLDELKDKVNLALEKIGMAGEGFAKVNLTVFPRVDTGNLRQKTTHLVDQSEEAVYIGTNVEYGLAVELGTGKYVERIDSESTDSGSTDSESVGGGKKGGMVASHYLRDAVSKHEKAYKMILKKTLQS
jgi:hypothetical protein